MQKPVNDDEVLQLMTALGLDSENEVTFRVTRHYFRNSVPLCCIAFNVHLWDQLCNYLPHDADEIEKLLETGDDTAMLCLGRDDYLAWVAQRLVNAPVLNRQRGAMGICRAHVASLIGPSFKFLFRAPAVRTEILTMTPTRLPRPPKVVTVRKKQGWAGAFGTHLPRRQACSREMIIGFNILITTGLRK